jgi:hypothetical protein
MQLLLNELYKKKRTNRWESERDDAERETGKLPERSGES